MRNDDYPNHLCSTEAAGYGTVVLWSRDFYMSTQYPFSLLELPIFIGASDWLEYRLSFPAIPALDVAMRQSSGKWDMAASRNFPNNWHMPLASFFLITFSILLRGMWTWWLPSWIDLRRDPEEKEGRREENLPREKACALLWGSLSGNWIQYPHGFSF